MRPSFRPDVAAARAQATVVSIGVHRAWTAWQPEVTLSGQFVHSSAEAQLDLGGFVQLVAGVFQLPPRNPELIPEPVVIAARNSRYATAQISQPLFTPAGVFLLGPAKAGAEAAELGALEAREQVLTDEQKFMDAARRGEARQRASRWATPATLLASKLERCMLKLTDHAQWITVRRFVAMVL